MFNLGELISTFLNSHFLIPGSDILSLESIQKVTQSFRAEFSVAVPPQCGWHKVNRILIHWCCYTGSMMANAPAAFGHFYNFLKEEILKTFRGHFAEQKSGSALERSIKNLIVERAVRNRG